MLAMTVGCVKTDDISAEQAGVMTLQLRNNELVATRATTAGVVDLNENLISTVQCFFSTDDTNVLYATDIIEVNDKDGVVENLSLTIPADKMGTLFPDEATNCNIYVVANAPEKITAKTIDDIKKTSISLAADGNNAQPTFVMDGSAVVTKTNDNSISGTVNLTRAAAKILVTANINKEIVFTSGEGESAKTETWTPGMASIRMTYHNSATESKLSAEATDASGYSNYVQPKTKEDGTLDGAVFTYTNPESSDKYVATQVIPFYSYPRVWDDNTTNKPYIELVIPWKRADDTLYSTYTYQIPLDIDADYLYATLTKADVEKASDVFINMMMPMVKMMCGIAVIIFCVVMYLMMKVMIDRSSFHISLMKIFGYRNKEVRKLYLNGNFYVIAVGAAVCIPIAKWLMDQMYPYMVSNVACGINLKFDAWLYVIIYLAVILCYLVINHLLVERLKKLVPAEVLKNRE